jgi:hypothetical protein
LIISPGLKKQSNIQVFKFSADDATKLFNDLESRRLTTFPILLFASDDWDPFKEALLNVYGILEQPPYCGIVTKIGSKGHQLWLRNLQTIFGH